MTISMYQASLPVFIKTLGNLSAILTKAVQHAQAQNIDPATLTTARLAPDMFPLTRQIQIATDGVKGCAARLAGVEVPSYPDTETTFDELQARIKKTVDYLASFTDGQIDGSEDKDISLKVGGKDLVFSGQTYLLSFVIPNFFFHVTTAYAILRHSGVPLGKNDYLGKIQDGVAAAA